MFRKMLATIFFMVLALTTIKAQETVYAEEPYTQRPSYGLFFDLNYNMHTSDFKGLPDCPSCSPGYTAGTGLGFQFGAFYALPIMPSWDLNIRLAYSSLSAVLSTEEMEVLSDKNGGSVTGKFLHEIDASLASAGIMPLMAYKPTDQINIYMGFRAGLMLQKTFSQKEEIIEPDFGVFEDTKTRIRHELADKDIPNASAIDFAVVGGLGYSIPLGNTFEWFLEPEIFFAYGLMPVAGDVTWNMSNLSGGIALRYAPRKEIPPVEPPKKAPLPPLPPPPLPPSFNAFITAVSVEEDGKESEVTIIRVDEFLSRKIHPLLNYVFFDDNNANISSKYSMMSEEDKKNFSPNYLANLKTMQVYYQILNIVGSRMQRFPNTTIRAIGCNSNQGAEAGNTTLSRQRAQNVKDFLVREWGIDDDRIIVEARNLPDIPSNATRKEGIEENRRVELKTEFNEFLFEPITIRDTIRNTNPPMLRFKPAVSSDVGVKSWKVVTYQGSVQLKTFEGTGMPPKVLELNLKEEQQFVPLLNEDFKYKLTVIDNDNQQWESEVQSMKVEPLTIQNKFLALIDGKEVDARDFDQFSLISFEFNKSELTPEHQPIIKLAKSRITETSKVDIEGRTDNTGDQARNLKLSKERADATADALKVDRKFAKGYGMDKPLYSNELPEGRFYNRTVYLMIETIIDMDFEE